MCEHVLLIDDDPRLVGALQIRLEAAGYTVHTAFNGDDGLSAARKLKPHLLILDVNMPGMDGLQVCRVLRADNQFRRTPMLVMSAITHEGAKRDAMEAGATQFIAKPYDAGRVMAVIRSSIDASKPQEAQTVA
jgi:DNA-binding response OmpR family regulator